jgi:hypothetical protein
MRGDSGSSAIGVDFCRQRSYPEGMEHFAHRFLPIACRQARPVASALGAALSPGSSAASPSLLGFALGSSVCSSVGSPVSSPVRSLSNRAGARQSQRQRRLRALRFADISASHRGRCMKCKLPASISPSIAPAALLVPLLLGAFAIASALATQRLLLHGPARRCRCAALKAAG